MQRRAVLYVSGNLDTFNPFYQLHNEGAANASEALFEWDADDGVENGEYLRVYQHGRRHEQPRRGSRTALLRSHRPHGPADGHRFSSAIAEPTNQGHTIVDAAFFTDRTGDGRCWAAGTMWARSPRPASTTWTKTSPAIDRRVFRDAIRSRARCRRVHRLRHRAGREQLPCAAPCATGAPVATPKSAVLPALYSRRACARPAASTSIPSRPAWRKTARARSTCGWACPASCCATATARRP